MATVRSSWNLFLVDLKDLNAELAMEDFVAPVSLAWSPDSDELAFSGAREHALEGTWLYNIGSGRGEFLTPRVLESLTWSGTESQLFGLEPVPVEGLGTKRLAVVTLGAPL